MKKKLLIVVGAGASIEFGLPSVARVDAILDRCASDQYPLADQPGCNLYRYCREAIDAYYSEAPKPGLRKWANFEEVLYQLNLLSQYMSDDYRLQGTNALLQAKPLPRVAEPASTPRAADRTVVRQMASTLIDEIVDHFIDACAAVTTDKQAEVGVLASFLAELKAEFDIGIVTLNYDNVFTQALPGLHTGFDTSSGRFDTMSVMARTDWDFIYHLHGSVHFAMTGVGLDMHAIRWRDTPVKDKEVHASGRNSQPSMEGTDYPTSPVVAGYGKTQQILRQPFRTYFGQLNRLVHDADSLLFLGYGFADLHLNSVFSEARDRHRPIVVVDWANDNQDPLPFRHDTWTHNLFRTLTGEGDAMSRKGGSAPALVSELKAERELEVSNNPQYPLAVWYNGMLEACRNPAKIMEHLLVVPPVGKS